LLSEHEQQTKQRLSKGEYILLKHNFANLVEINSVFSNLLKSDPDFNALNMDFIEAVKKLIGMILTNTSKKQDPFS
jgi:hypothetical protein